MATKRSVPYKVTLTPELHERLREVAAQLGQAPATCASMAIGQWVSQMHRNLGAGDRAIDAMVKEAGPELREQLKLMGGKD
jgi:predicted DNA-binding protein